jgi:diacylglycerol kinase family enzyme
MDLIIYNPLSKNAKSNVYTHKLVRKYKKKGIPFRLRSILKIDDIRLYLEKKIHIDNVILLGGDGTINRFVNDIVEYDIKQTIYLKSNGSGNDYLRSLKSNDHLPQTVMEASFDNGDKTYFMNGIGMGVDGLVATYVNALSHKGKLRYLISTLKALIAFVPEPTEIKANGKTYKFDKTYIVAANNGKYFGGGMKIAPKADISSDELDVIIVHTINKWLILPIFFTIYLGLHPIFKRWVTCFKADSLEVNFTTPQLGQADGEGIVDVSSMRVMPSNKKLHLRYYDHKKSTN